MAVPATSPAAPVGGAVRRSARASTALVAALAVLLLAAGATFTTQLVMEVTSAPGVAGHHDFLAFHAAATMVANGAAGHLYDAGALTALERHVIDAPVGAAGYMPYLTPPLGAVLQSPLAALSEPSARILWLVLNVPLALACCWLALGSLPGRARLLATACLAGTFPFFQAFVEGQWSFLMLAGCLAALLVARRGHAGWAGVGLAALILKPPLLVPVVVVLIAMRAWRTLATTVAVAGTVWLVSLPFTGWSTQLDYAGYLVSVVGSHLTGAGAAGAAAWHGGINAMEGINGLVAGYVGQQNVTVLDALSLVGVVAVLAWWVAVAARTGLDLASRAGRWAVVAAVAAALLTDLHLYGQDCVLVLVALPVLLSLVPPSWRLGAALAVAAVLDAAWLDQLTITPHLFTWLLAGGFVLASVLALRESRPAMAHRQATVLVAPLR